MTAGNSPTLATRQLLGAGVLLLGAVLLAGNLGWAPVHALSIETCAALQAALPALGLAAYKAVVSLVFSPHWYFTVLRGVLVSCWPLALIAAGAALLIRSQVARKQRAGIHT